MHMWPARLKLYMPSKSFDFMVVSAAATTRGDVTGLKPFFLLSESISSRLSKAR